MAEFGPPPQLTRDDLIEVLRRNFEPHWIEGLLADPSSLSNFEGLVAAVLRVQDAIDENLFRGAFILTAPGRAKARSVVRLFREGGGAEGVVDVNVRFLENRSGGSVWRAVAPFTVPASGVDQTVDVPIQSDRYGYYLNSFEPLSYLILDDLFDANLVAVPGPDPAADGKTSFLEQHGKERRVFRAQGETDQQYRNRIRFIEDQVSPTAIANAVVEILDAFPTSKPVADLVVRDGLRVVREPFEDTAQHAQRGLTGSPGPMFFDDVLPIPLAAPTLDDGGTFFDDTVKFLRDVEDACAWFDVVIPTLVDPDEGRRFYDDSDGGAGAYFDDAFTDDVASEAITGPIAALADELDRRRAACVRFRILVGEDIGALRHPPFQSLAQAGTWADQDGAVADLELTSALAEFDGDATFVATQTGEGAGAALDAGDLLFTMPAITPPLSVTRVVLRARARKVDVGAGVDPVLAFLIRPSTAGAAVRLTAATSIVDEESYREFKVILDENPLTAAAWTLADIAGTFDLGVANAAAIGATEELRVSELSLEIVLNHG